MPARHAGDPPPILLLIRPSSHTQLIFMPLTTSCDGSTFRFAKSMYDHVNGEESVDAAESVGGGDRQRQQPNGTG